MRKSVMSVVLVCAAVGLLTGQAFSHRKGAGEDAQIYIAPQTLVLSCNVICVTVHTNVPFVGVDPDTVQLTNEADASIEDAGIFPDSRGNLVAKFAIGDVAKIVEPGSVTLTLWVGGERIGSDTITVKE